MRDEKGRKRGRRKKRITGRVTMRRKQDSRREEEPQEKRVGGNWVGSRCEFSPSRPVPKFFPASLVLVNRRSY